jgi:DNA polymerase V
MGHSIDLRSLLAARFHGRPVIIIPYHTTQSLRLPFFETRVPAGFPSPAEDYLDRGLDLNELVVKHPAATFFVRVEGESMIGAGIHPGDTLVVDRAEQAAHGRIVVAVIDGDFTVKRIRKIDGKLLLASENSDLPPLHIAPEAGFEVWGVVTYVIHRIR